MFDQAFSFGSSSTSISANNYHHADISPYSSPPASPRFSPRQTSTGTSDRDTVFHSSDKHYRSSLPLSVMALTTQLKDHAIGDILPSDPLDSTLSPLPPPSDPSTIDQDEGFFDGPSSPNTNYSEDDSDFDPTLWDLSHMSATSSPRPSLSLEAQALSSYTQRRRQRQALVRLQCIAQRAPDLAMLIEERHPSSLPLACEMLFSRQRRSQSTSTDHVRATSGLSRVEKPGCSCVRKPIKIRKRATR